MRDVIECEIKDGLLAKKVRLANGEYHYVPVIPAGGARAITWSGQKRVLTWRNWILHVLHNSTAGGHVGEHALEQRVLEVAWWKRLGRDCHSWCMRCAVCRAIKGQPQGGTTWRSERYTAPFRVVMVDLVGPLEPPSEGYRYILTAMDVFSLWSWLVPLETKDPKEVAGTLTWTSQDFPSF